MEIALGRSEYTDADARRPTLRTRRTGAADRSPVGFRASPPATVAGRKNGSVPPSTPAGTAPSALQTRHILATARGGGVLAAGSAFEFASRFLIALLLARLLGVQDYGLYVLSIGAATVFAGIALLGLDDAMVRYVAILSGRKDGPGVWGTMQIGIVVSTLAGLLMAGVLFVGARPFAEGIFHEPRLTSLLHLCAVIVPFLVISNVLAGIARGFRRMDYVAFAENVVMSLVRLALLAGLAIWGKLSLTAALVVFGISDVAATVTLIVLLNRRFPLRRPLRREVRRDPKEIFRFAGPLWLTGLLRQFSRNIEAMLLGALKTISSAGIFSIVDKVNLVGHISLLSILSSVQPILAQLHDQRDRGALRGLYSAATRWTFALNIPFFLVMVLYPRAILAVFGDAFVTGSTALVIVAFAELANAGTGICGPMIDMTGHTRVKLANAVLTSALVIGGSIVLIPRWGITGAATASLIAIVTVNLARVLEVWFLERLIPYSRAFLKPVVAGSAALIAGLLLRRWMPVDTHVGRALFQGALVGATYLGLLFLLRLTPEDRFVLERVAHKARSTIGRISVGARGKS
jgi:O-antigen/teichoic acid export membrane protein